MSDQFRDCMVELVVTAAARSAAAVLDILAKEGRIVPPISMEERRWIEACVADAARQSLAEET